MANNTNWLNISSQSGSSGQTILTLSANKNLSTNYKTAEITAYNPVYNISAKTYVTLEAYSPILSISPDLFGVPDSGGTYELTISANCAWVIAFPDLVTSYSTTAGTGNAVVTFTVPGTTADTTLVGNIVVTDESGQVSRTARVEQYGSGVHIGVFPVELYFDSTGGSKTFSITADCAYNVSVGSGTDWAFVEPHSGYTGQTTFTVTVNSENTGTTDKQGVINIDAPGQDLAVILYQRKPETRVVATYYVTSTTDPTRILRSTASFSAAEYPDGTQITLGTGYTFPTTGYQTVYYTLTESTVGGFQNSGALTSVVIPKGVTVIANNTFSSCSGLTSVTIPNTVTQLGVGSFNQCTSLSSITLPDSLQTIAGSAFNKCTSLSSITVPSTVTNIGTNCFSGSSVSSITFTSLTPPTLGNTNALTSNTLSEIIVPCPAVNDYITAWPQYAKYISCQDTGTTLYFITDTSNVKGVGEVRTITILNTNINPNRTGLNLPGAFPQQGAYTVDGNVIYLTYPKNPSSSSTRTWTIGVVAQTKDGVSLRGAYRITQNANGIHTIPFTADTSTVDASGETRTITIDASNLVASSITIGVEGATGVTYTYENGVITITFPENTGTSRNITVNISAITTNGDNAFTTIIYRQGDGIGGAYFDFTYLVTSTTEPTQIMYGRGIQYTRVGLSSTYIGKAEYNGVEIPVYTAYTFPATGLQTIRYYLASTDTYDPYSSSYGKSESDPSSITTDDYQGRVVPRFQFMNCHQLVSAVFSDGIFSIAPDVFSNCSNLKTVEFGSGLRNIYNEVFDYLNNDNVRTIIFNSPTGPAYNMTGGSMSNYNLGLHPPSGSGSFDGVYPVWYYPSGWTAEEIARWERQISLKSLPLPDGRPAKVSITYNVTTTSEDTKISNGMRNFYQVEYPDGTISGIYSGGRYYRFSSTGPQTLVFTLTGKTMDRTDFKGLDNILNVSLGIYCEDVGGFEGCDSLTGVVLSEGVKTIRSGCFKDCTSLVHIQMTTGLTQLSSSAFNGCISLQSIDIPSSVTELPAACLSGCSALTHITLPDSITEIKGWAFTDCTSLTGVTFPNNALTNLSLGKTFYGCSALQTLVFPNNIKDTGSTTYPFYGCNNLTSLTLGNSFTCIPELNCVNLQYLSVGSGAYQTGQNIGSPFTKCSALTTIKCYFTNPPDGYNSTPSGLPEGGTLYYPAGSNFEDAKWVKSLKNLWHWTLSPTL